LVQNDKVRDLFALLTVAKGALRQDEVEELTGLSEGDLENLPHQHQVTRWFSIGESLSSADLPTYSFAHPLLAKEFRDYLNKKGKRVRRMEERLLKWCENWREHPSFPYTLRHYAEHLYEKCPMTNERMTNEQMTNYAELCRLALDSDFKQAQTQHLPDEPNLPLKTVQLALDAAIQLEDALTMARLLIEHAKRAQSEAETPLQAWRKGHRERALELATDFVFKRDHKLGTLWSLLLAWVAESEGERDWSKRFLDEVRKRWEGAKLEKLRDLDWEGKMAAFLLGELGQREVEGAIEVAGLVLDDKSKEELATGWASKRLFDQALKVAEGIERAGRRSGALSEIAGEMAKAGMEDWAKEIFDRALKVAEGIEKAWERAEALIAIAGEMAKAGMVERMEEVFARALQAAEEIETTWWRSRALREIAGEMAKVGMFDQALKVAEGIKWARWRAEALIAIAGEMAKAGMFEQALKVAEGIEDARERAEALRDIVGEMAKAGMLDQALKVAEGIEDARERAGALAAIAEGMAKAGMTDWAKEVFDQALKVAEGIEEAEKRAWALREIAEGMARSGEVEGAVSIVEREMAVRTEGLPSVLSALAWRARKGDGRSKEGFLKLLPWCGWSLKFAYQACGLLAWLYPERGEEIAGVIAATGD
jgi:tetratricopeptide (TPR) repeat protein